MTCWNLSRDMTATYATSHSISWHVLDNFRVLYNCRLKKFKDKGIKANADFTEQKIRLRRAHAEAMMKPYVRCRGTCRASWTRGRGGTSPGISWIHLSVWYTREKYLLSKKKRYLLLSVGAFFVREDSYLQTIAKYFPCACHRVAYVACVA